MNLKKRLKLHEGYRGRPYICASGYWTFGYGHRIHLNGGLWISKKVATLILKEDIKQARKEFKSLNMKMNRVRSGVCVEMIFWHGLNGFCGFIKTILALRNEDWDTAADEMMDSNSGRKYSKRMIVLANIMRKGQL